MVESLGSRSLTGRIRRGVFGRSDSALAKRVSSVAGNLASLSVVGHLKTDDNELVFEPEDTSEKK